MRERLIAIADSIFYTTGSGLWSLAFLCVLSATRWLCIGALLGYGLRLAGAKP
jgi:hypothetical protein